VIHHGLFKDSKAKIEDFMPQRGEKPDEQPDIRSVFAMLKTKAAQNRAK
jgi:hypothetical protein